MFEDAVLYFSRRGIPRTKLMKLLFLLDALLSKRGNGIGVRWVYYTYGPFSREVLDLLDRMCEEGLLSLKSTVSSEGDPVYVYRASGRPSTVLPEFEYIYGVFGGMNSSELVKYTHGLLDSAGVRKGSVINPGAIDIEGE